MNAHDWPIFASAGGSSPRHVPAQHACWQLGLIQLCEMHSALSAQGAPACSEPRNIFKQAAGVNSYDAVFFSQLRAATASKHACACLPSYWIRPACSPASVVADSEPVMRLAAHASISAAPPHFTWNSQRA